jgi:outer membrane biosynthesis protein TonB
MERRSEINLPLTVTLSLCLHLFIVWVVLMPSVTGIPLRTPFGGQDASGGGSAGRDIIVNANEDEKANLNNETLLSDKDSSGKGFITRKKGDTFLNNSLDFSMPGAKSSQSGRAVSAVPVTLPQSAVKETDPSSEKDAEMDPEGITFVPMKNNPALPAEAASNSDSEWTKIPDKKGISRENSIFISNEGSFSFNTKKFTDYRYFRDMKSKISSNWYPPIAGNTYMIGEANRYGSYTPGYTRIMTIPPQEVRLFFRMNRKGDVVDVTVVDSGGAQSLVDSCVDSIKNSKSFGPVPADIEGETVVINFIFGYYVN